MQFRHVGIIVFCALLCACKSFQPPAWPWKSSSAPADTPICSAPGKACTNSDARVALLTASKYCYDVMNRQGTKSAAMGGTKLAIGTIGAISGSVIAQFAEGAAAQAWSGVSGVANGMQTQIDQNFAGAIDIKRREHIAQAAFAGAARIEAADTPEAKIDLAIQMALACSMNAATADANILKLLSGEAEHPGTAEPVDSYDLQGKQLTVHHRFEGIDGIPAAETHAKAQAAEVCRKQSDGFVAKAQTPANTHCAGSHCEVEAKFECGS